MLLVWVGVLELLVFAGARKRIVGSGSGFRRVWGCLVEGLGFCGGGSRFGVGLGGERSGKGGGD